jgi:hypothetical protein
MGGEVFSSLSSSELVRRFWNEHVEPVFGPRSAPRSTTRGRKLTLEPEVSAPSRRTDADAARSPVGILLYLVSIGFVAAAIIGVCFGVGFFLLASPAAETIADFDRNPPNVYANASDARRETVFLPARPSGEPPAETASVTEPGSSSAASPASPMPLASPPPFAAEDDVFSAGAKGRPARYGRSAHARTASQHSRPRSARSLRQHIQPVRIELGRRA